MRLAAALLLTGLLLPGCGEGDGYPCAERFAELPERVSLYEWAEGDVYLIEPHSPERYDGVFSTECEFICAPSGGSDDLGDGKCPYFYEQSTFKRVVAEPWADGEGNAANSGGRQSWRGSS